MCCIYLSGTCEADAPSGTGLAAVARIHWRSALPKAVLVPLSATDLSSAALHSRDVRTVAALRSTSMVVAAALASWLLDGARRIAGVIVTSFGVVVVALST